MGCGGSRDSGDKEIDYNMEWIASHEFNTFFSECENTLKIAEDLRAGWEDSKDEMYDISSVDFLKSPPVLMDAIKVWVWTLAALNDGDISKCKIAPTKESPYLDCDIGKQCSQCSNNPNVYHEKCAQNQCAKFKEALKTYIQTCIEGVKQLPDILEQLQKLAERAKTLKESGSDAFSHLGTLDKAKNLGKVGKNTLKLTKAIGKLKDVQPLVPEAVKNMEQVIKEIQDVIKGANEQAKKYLEKKIPVSPADIMQHLHPAEKYNESQIKKMKAEAEKKRKQQEEEKKKKADFMTKFQEAKKALQSSEQKK